LCVSFVIKIPKLQSIFLLYNAQTGVVLIYKDLITVLFLQQSFFPIIWTYFK